MCKFPIIRIISTLGFVILVGIALYLGLREDSCFFSVPWMPRKIAVPIQHATLYRNFIGFGIVGLYVGMVFGKGTWPRINGKWDWVILGLLILPLLKEVLQIPLPNRHGTFAGAFHGLSGIILGLAIGKVIHVTVRTLFTMWKPNANLLNTMNTPMKTRLDLFDAKDGLNRGRPGWYEAIWYLVKCTFFLSPLPWPSKFKCALLRVFGAKVGTGVNIKPRVNIHFPWKFEIGEHSWIGEEVFILNFELIKIGSHACISQRVFLCGGNHDFRDAKFKYRNGPIHIGNGAWVGAQVFVGPGITVEDEAVICAGAIVTKDMPAGMICSGNPCVAFKTRWV